MNKFFKIAALTSLVIATALTSACNKTGSGVEGKALKLVLKDSIKTSDPTAAYDVVSTEVIDQIYENLLQYDYDSEKPKLIPLLADEMPAVSKDQKTYTIKIKKNIRFQDDECFANGKGRAVTVDDFIYALKRHADPKNESQAFWTIDGKVIGINDFQKKFGAEKGSKEVMKESVEGLEKIDDYTFKLKLSKPYPQIMYIMAMHFFSPIPYEAVEKYGKDFVNHPVGTGPFKVKSWNPTSRVILVKNPNFAERKEMYKGKQLPLVDGLEFNVVKEDQPRWLGFINGEYDQIQIPKDNFSSAIKKGSSGKLEVADELAKKGIRLSGEPSFNMWYATFNTKDSVLGKNKYLRQAIASAIDSKAWLEIFKNGRGSLQTDVSPPSIVDRCGGTYKWTYNIERAKQLLAKAGYPEGKDLPTLRWDTRGAELSERQLAEFITKSLAAIGIKVEINANTFPAFLDKMNKGALQMSKGGWMMDYPDAENNMQLLYGPNKSPGPNDANFDNAEYNKLYEQIAVMPSNAPGRKALLCKMEAIVQEEAPWAYGIYEDEYRLVQSWVNYHTAELVNNKYKYIDTTRK